MRDLERRSGALMGLIAYLVAVGVGLACDVPLMTVLLRGAIAGAGGYVLGRLLAHVVLQAFLDDVAEARSKQAEKQVPDA